MIDKRFGGNPKLGMGTWGIGGTWEPDIRRREAEIDALRYGLSIGYRLIDTAELYGRGTTEEIVGQAIDGYAREDLTIITKVSRDHLRFDDVLRAAEGSLRRLGTGHIDLYLVHRPSEEVPIDETLRALGTLVDRGLVRAIGVSNVDLAQLRMVLARTPIAISACQIEFSIFKPEAGEELLPFCLEHGIEPQAYRPLGRGGTPLLHNALTTVAERHGRTSIQVALSWIMDQGVIAIPKASQRRHLRENWEAQQIHLVAEDVELLRDAQRTSRR